MGVSVTKPSTSSGLRIAADLREQYPDIYTPEARAALAALARFNPERLALMQQRIERRARRMRDHEPITFLDPQAPIGRTGLTAQDARAGQFDGSEIPADLQRQWIQGTGPGTKPNATVAQGIRNVAYALLSGAEIGRAHV